MNICWLSLLAPPSNIFWFRRCPGEGSFVFANGRGRWERKETRSVTRTLGDRLILSSPGSTFHINLMPLIQFQARDTECYCASIISAYLCFGKKERLLDFLSINGNKFMVFCQILGICWLCVIFLLIPLKQHDELGTFYSQLLRDRVVQETL